MSENEVWKDVVGYEGIYKVSNQGNVHSVERMDARGRKRGGFTLKPNPIRGGYLQVDLRKDGVRKNKLIHRLVLEAFVPNSDNHPEVNHRDENKSNNNVENLEWCTSKYNTNYGTRNERVTQTLSKKVRAVNVETGEVIVFSSTKEAKSKGYSGGRVSEACRGVYKNIYGALIGDGHTYKGHQWSYE